MGWTGTFVLGHGYAAYFGKAGDNEPHQHAAIQLVQSSTDLVTVEDKNGRPISAKRLLIAPQTVHALHAISDVVSIYAEPQTELGTLLLGEIDSGGISVFEDSSALAFEADDAEKMLNQLDALALRASSEVDPRLLKAMSVLSKPDAEPSIARVATMCGVPLSTLRYLAKKDLGLPLSTWLIWRKLERAANALSMGETLTDAAYLGGFSDQAHLCRVTKRMFGITPGAAAGALNWRTRDKATTVSGRL